MADRRVLLIGDDAEVRDGVRAACERAGAALTVAATLGDGLRALSASPQRATVLLASAVDEDGAIIRRIAAAPNAGMLVLVARAPSLRLAIEAPRLGAAELLTVPLDVGRLAALLSPAPSTGAVVPLPRRAAGPGDELVGSSPALVDAFKTVGRVAGSDATVLVTGESGTGKELVARALHAASGRAGGPFVAVNCAAIPEDLLESELFGHERGAFTGAIARKVGRFERANGGTLFLDEIGDMSLVLQAKILRALQEREIERLGGEERIRLDVRVVAATHRDLPSLIASGDFREDLFYRLAVVKLHLPALRERPGDVRALALHYAARFAAEHGRALRGIADEAMRSLEAHAWPGNVRELRNVLERAVLLAPGDVLQVDHLQLGPAAAPAQGAAGGADSLPGYSAGMTMAQVEALHIGQVLGQVDGHFGRAAEILDMHRNTVSRKAIQYGVIAG
ncbi:MAG TPA: sigma-54 dependent transcriptional regulator [Longimicrobium sp.]|nr:sigma-54 dependent transcriptional regulator [Longimicrobium sp.]